MGCAAAAPTRSIHASWVSLSTTWAGLLRKDAAGCLQPPHWALFRPEPPRRSAAYFKRSASAGALPWLLRLSLGPAASGCGHVCVGRRALSLKTFPWKSGKAPAALGRKAQLL